MKYLKIKRPFFLIHRSILTTPWFEMGGTCHINCEKTGYSAKIDFHEKPLIGGEKHRLP